MKKVPKAFLQKVVSDGGIGLVKKKKVNATFSKK
jgi:hypothetical protein